MAQNYTLMARKNLLKPDETPKYYAVARSGRKVTVKEVCKRITERSSYSKGELEGCIGEFLLEIVNVLEEGNIVQMGDLGNFRMSIKTGTPTDTVKEFNVHAGQIAIVEPQYLEGRGVVGVVDGRITRILAVGARTGNVEREHKPFGQCSIQFG